MNPAVGYGFRDALWPDVPHRGVLDSACGERAAVMISADLHSAWLNSAALRQFAFPDENDGLVREGDAMRVISEVALMAGEASDALAAAAGRAAAARGVVGIVDFEKPSTLLAWQRRIANGNGSLRVVSAFWPERLDDAIAQHLRTGDAIDGTAGLLTMGPLKILADGSLNTRTAYCHDAYLGSAHERGLLLVQPGELSRLMRRATDAGLECAAHAIGDAANALVLEAFSETGARGSIEHAQLIDDDDIGRFAAARVIASVQPEHAMDDRDVADRYWSGRTRRAFPLRSLLDTGAVLAFGSDAPVAPLDPWLAIAAAVHRTRDHRAAWHPEQRITLREALDASVPPGRGGATLCAGAPADLVVLDDDLFAADPRRLRSMPVAATMLAGNWTFRADL